jgi:hypothetical protein
MLVASPDVDLVAHATNVARSTSSRGAGRAVQPIEDALIGQLTALSDLAARSY